MNRWLVSCLLLMIPVMAFASEPPPGSSPPPPIAWDGAMPEFDGEIPGIPRATLLGDDPKPDPFPPTPPPRSDRPPHRDSTNLDWNEGTPRAPDGEDAAPGDMATLRFRIRRGGRPAAGCLTLLSQEGEIVDAVPGFSFRWIHPDGELRVPAGGYTIRIEAGLRTSPWMGLASISAGQVLDVEAELQPYSPTGHVGWHFVDPFLYAYTRPPQPGRFSYPDLDAIRLAGAAEEIRMIGVSHAWNLPGPEGVPFARMEGGTAALAEAFSGGGEGACTLFAAWTFSHPVTGRFYALEASPPPASERFVQEGALPERFTRIQDRAGLVILSHPTGVIEDPARGTTSEVAGDFIFHTLAGPLYDAIDIQRRGADLELWQMLLSRGYRIPAVGGGPGLRLPAGLDRPEPSMVVELPQRTVTFPQLRDALRAGRSVVGTGPFIRLYVDGIGSGGSVAVSDRPRHVFVDAYATSDPDDSIEAIEIIYNGNVIHEWEGAHKQKTVSGQTRPLRLDRPGWIQARYRSTDPAHWALTNPVYIGESRQPRPLQAKATLRVSDPDGTPLPARVEAIQFGTPILRREGTTGEALTLRLPATARLRVSSPGHRTREVDLYRDTEAGAFIQSLRDSNDLRARMMAWSTYETFTRLMQSLTLEVTLEPEASR